MKTRWVLTTLTAALSAFALSVTLNPQQVAAQECNNATINCAYYFELSGWIGKKVPFLPAVASRLVNFDGHGNREGGGFTVVTGSVWQISLLGTYDVKPDCTVNFAYTVLNEDGSLNSVTTLFGVIVNRGEEVRKKS